MTFPTFFQLSRNAISPTSSGESEGSLSYWVFGCVEQRDANLKPLSQSARKRFAVMYRKAIGDDLIDTLAQVHDQGGMSPVKLIDVSENSLYIILDACVASSTVASIESIWLKAIGAEDSHWSVRFASESEVWSGRSDYAFLSAAKEVLESNELGLIPNNFATSDGYSHEKAASDDLAAHSSLEQTEHAPLAASVVESYSSAVRMFVNHKSLEMTEHYSRTSPPAKKQKHIFLKKIALYLISGLRVPEEPVHWPLAEDPGSGSFENDILIMKLKATVGHQALSNVSDYVAFPAQMGVCPNDFSSRMAKLYRKEVNEPEHCRIPRALVQCYLSDLQARLGHRSAKTIERNLHAFINFLHFCESHAPQSIGRCLNEPEHHPTEPNIWAHRECARCGNAMIPLRSKYTDMPK